jgi:hypothetical protein
MCDVHRCTDLLDFESSSLYGRNLSNSDRTGDDIIAVVAESDLTGLPYGSSASNAQPRIGNDDCGTCQPGTVSNREGQR